MTIAVAPFPLDGSKGQGRRWTASLLAVLVAHAALGVVLYDWHAHPPMELPAAPVVMLDLEPLPVPPPPPPPQPEQLVPPEPEPPVPLPEPIPVPVPQPEVALPPPPPKPTPKPRPKPVEQKPIERPVELPPPVVSEKPPEPRIQPPPAAAPAVPSVDPLAIYKGRVQAMLQQNIRAPNSPRLRGQKRTALVLFTVDRSGKVLAMKIDHSSGQDLVDEEALATLRRSNPLPAFPADLTRDQMEMLVPLEFTFR